MSTFIGFVSDICLGGIKDRLNERYDEYKIIKEISSFAERQFESSFIYLNKEQEIVFEGLQDYIINNLSDELNKWLFHDDYKIRNKCREEIIVEATSYAEANNPNRKKIIVEFIESALKIARNYYINQAKNEDKLLHALTQEQIIFVVKSSEENIIKRLDMYEKEMDEYRNKVESNIIRNYLTGLPSRPEMLLYRDSINKNPRGKPRGIRWRLTAIGIN